MADEKNKIVDVEDDDREDIDTGVDTGTDDSGKDNDQHAGATGTNKKSERTFTQAQVTNMMAREKKQGRNAALKELGIDPKDNKLVQMVQAFINSQKSEEDKAAERQAEEASKLAEAEAKAMRAECKAEAMVLGAKAEYVDDVIVLALAKMDEDSDFKTIIGEIKTKYPTFFGIDTNVDEKDGEGKDGKDGKDNKDEKDKQNKKATGKKGTGASMRNLSKDNNKDDNKKSLGSRLAAQRKGADRKGTNFIKR